MSQSKRHLVTSGQSNTKNAPDTVEPELRAGGLCGLAFDWRLGFGRWGARSPETAIFGFVFVVCFFFEVVDGANGHHEILRGAVRVS